MSAAPRERTVLQGTGWRDWPVCAVCSETKLDSLGRKQRVPVEAYHVEETKPRRITSAKRIVVVALCSHKGTIDGRYVQAADIEVPYWWGDAHERAAVARLVFFAPGMEKKPDHGLVTDIGG